MVLDPPYGILPNEHWDEKAWDTEDFVFMLANLEVVNTNMQCTFVTFCSHEMFEDVKEAIRRSSFIEPKKVTWWKGNSVGQGNRFLDSTELMVFAWRSGKNTAYWNYKPEEVELRNDCWKEPNIGSGLFTCQEDGNPINRAQKPQSLLRRLVRHHCPGGGRVLDLCAGSHSLMVACINEGRSCISFEDDPRQHLAAAQFIQAMIDATENEDKHSQRKGKGKKRKAPQRASPVQDQGGSRASGARVTLLATQAEGSRQVVASQISLVVRPSAGELFGNACMICARQASDADPVSKCLHCSGILHPKCAWSYVLGPERTATGDQVIHHICDKNCWLAHGLEPDHVPLNGSSSSSNLPSPPPPQ